MRADLPWCVAQNLQNVTLLSLAQEQNQRRPSPSYKLLFSPWVLFSFVFFYSLHFFYSLFFLTFIFSPFRKHNNKKFRYCSRFFFSVRKNIPLYSRIRRIPSSYYPLPSSVSLRIIIFQSPHQWRSFRRPPKRLRRPVCSIPENATTTRSSSQSRPSSVPTTHSFPQSAAITIDAHRCCW